MERKSVPGVCCPDCDEIVSISDCSRCDYCIKVSADNVVTCSYGEKQESEGK